MPYCENVLFAVESDPVVLSLNSYSYRYRSAGDK